MEEVLFISPHLDDAVLSCGGAILRLASGERNVTVVTACTADPPDDATLSPGARRFHASWDLGDTPFGRRCEEDVAAVRLLGARSRHLGLLDAMYRVDDDGRPVYARPVNTPLHPGDAEAFLSQLRPRLAEVLESASASHVFCPMGVGGHVDHMLVRQAVEQLYGTRGLVYYEEYPYLSPRDTTQPWPQERGRWRLTVLALTPRELSSRVEAVACYRSQLRGLFPTTGERVREIISARIPRVGRRLATPDLEPPVERAGKNVRRAVAACGGERYWSPAGSDAPFPPAGLVGGDDGRLG